ncbi:MAG: cytochrome-ba3 oxidase subunit [Halolamina sp.]
MSARRSTAIGLAALVPVWVYALGVEGGIGVAVASTASVLLIVGGLYVMLGPHEEGVDVDGV